MAVQGNETMPRTMGGAGPVFWQALEERSSAQGGLNRRALAADHLSIALRSLEASHEELLAEGLETLPVTLFLRGLHKVRTVTSHPKNAGYRAFKDRIEDLTGTRPANASWLAGFITHPYEPEWWERGHLMYETYRETFTFHPDNEPFADRFQHKNPTHYPKAVTIEPLTYEKCLLLKDVGPERAITLMKFVLALACPDVTSIDLGQWQAGTDQPAGD